jgi:hypothetical protein
MFKKYPEEEYRRLFDAVRRSDIKYVQECIDKKMNINHSHDKKTLLSKALDYDCHDCLKLLLENGLSLPKYHRIHYNADEKKDEKIYTIEVAPPSCLNVIMQYLTQQENFNIFEYFNIPHQNNEIYIKDLDQSIIFKLFTGNKYAGDDYINFTQEGIHTRVESIKAFVEHLEPVLKAKLLTYSLYLIDNTMNHRPNHFNFSLEVVSSLLFMQINNQVVDDDVNENIKGIKSDLFKYIDENNSFLKTCQEYDRMCKYQETLKLEALMNISSEKTKLKAKL